MCYRLKSEGGNVLRHQCEQDKVLYIYSDRHAGGVSAILIASRFNAVSTSNMGLTYELDAIAAVIIGGTAMTGGRGTIWGTVFGAVILGIINNMMNMVGVSPYLQGTVKGLVIIIAVYFQKQKQ